ncbi:MAG: hypothetical protein EDR02_02420 [Actinobacteria bacterium]|nr:MAG: hypothetical protein EDR02_02420 [Actinomycetota bacterium]
MRGSLLADANADFPSAGFVAVACVEAVLEADGSGDSGLEASGLGATGLSPTGGLRVAMSPLLGRMQAILVQAGKIQGRLRRRPSGTISPVGACVIGEIT